MVRRSASVLALGASLLAVTSCAGIWGFDPLSLGSNGNAGADAGDSGDAVEAGSGRDATVDTGAGGDAGCAAGNPGCTGGCVGACESGTDAPPSSTLFCQGSNGTCSCGQAASANSAACSPASLGVAAADVVCCADPGYPANGACMCEWIGCASSNGNCICGPLNNQPGGSCAAQSWTCCIQTGAPECVCSTGACLSGFTPFGNSCGVPDVKCGGVQRKVAACN